MVTETPEDTARRLFQAMNDNDMAAVDAIYADDFALWHSFDKHVRDRATCLHMIGELGKVAKRNYRLIDSVSNGNRVAQRYELTLNAPEIWMDHRIDLAVFLTFKEGRLVRMEEYIDSRDAADAAEAAKILLQPSA